MSRLSLTAHEGASDTEEEEECTPEKHSEKTAGKAMDTEEALRVVSQHYEKRKARLSLIFRYHI